MCKLSKIMSKFSYIFRKNTGVRQASRREKFKFLFLNKTEKQSKDALDKTDYQLFC